MKSTFISREEDKAKFSMAFTAEEFEDAKIKVYKREKGKFVIDGFRKGKAPRSIIEARYGKGIFAEDAINDLLSENYSKALDELSLEPIDSPSVDFEPMKEKEGFTASVTVAVWPEREIKDYKGVEVEEEPVSVTDEDVENELEAVRHRNARAISVDRPVKDGDSILLDFCGFVDGEAFAGGSADGYELKIGSGAFIPGFEEQLVGAEKEKEVDVNVTFPEDYRAEELAGRDALFKCTVHEIREEELPELDDEFVQDISEFDTLDAYKENAREKIRAARETVAVRAMKDRALEKVAEANDFSVPDVMVEDEISAMMQEFDGQLRAQGMDLKGYLEFVGREEADFRNDMKENAARRVKERIILRGIAAQEKLEATDEDVDARLSEMAKEFGVEKDKMKDIFTAQDDSMFRENIKVDKALTLIYENSRKVPKKEAQKEEKAEDGKGAEEA